MMDLVTRLPLISPNTGGGNHRYMWQRLQWGVKATASISYRTNLNKGMKWSNNRRHLNKPPESCPSPWAYRGNIHPCGVITLNDLTKSITHAMTVNQNSTSRKGKGERLTWNLIIYVLNWIYENANLTQNAGVAPESIYLQWEGAPILERSGSHDSCYQYLSSSNSV